MPQLIDYKGLKIASDAGILDPEPINSGGLAIQNDIKILADSAPTLSTSDPGINDDSTKDYFVGSMWLNSASQVMWVCTNASAGSAVWRSLFKRADGQIIFSPDSGDAGSAGIQIGTDGDARGTDAVDFQTSRTAANQVAAGNRSFIAGGSGNRVFNNSLSHYAHVAGWNCSASQKAANAQGRNTQANGAYSHAEGQWNSVSGKAAHVEGSSCVATALSAHAEGSETKAYGIGSHSEGSLCIASGDYSHSEGWGNEASGKASHCEGGGTGIANLAQGASSHAEGGFTHAVSDYSHAQGYQSEATLFAQHAHAAGNFSSIGDAQASQVILRNKTTNDTWTELFINGLSLRLVLENDTTWSFLILVVARQENDDTKSGGWRIEGCIRRGANAASTTLVGSSVTVLGEDVASWDANVEADTTYGSLKVKVKGAASDNVRWVAFSVNSQVTG